MSVPCDRCKSVRLCSTRMACRFKRTSGRLKPALAKVRGKGMGNPKRTKSKG